MKQVVFILILISHLVFAQEKEVHVTKKTSDLNSIYSISYFGEQLLHPGLRFTTEKPLRMVTKEKSKPRFFKASSIKEKTKIRTFSLAGNFITYVHFNNQISIMPSAMTVWRTYKSSGFYRSIGIGAGFALHYYTNPVYTIDIGELERPILGKSQYLTLPIQLEMGYDLSKLLHFDVHVFSRFTSHILMFYNSGSLPVIALELGALKKL